MKEGVLMVKGGYRIIDFKDINIISGGDAVVIAGVYDVIEDAYRKPLLLSGITLDGVEKPDCFISCDVSDSNYTFTAYGKTFTVTDENKVSITE